MVSRIHPAPFLPPNKRVVVRLWAPQQGTQKLPQKCITKQEDHTEFDRSYLKRAPVSFRVLRNLMPALSAKD